MTLVNHANKLFISNLSKILLTFLGAPWFCELFACQPGPPPVTALRTPDLNPVPSWSPNYVVAKRAKDGFLQCSQWGSRKQEFQMSKLDFIIRITKPRWQARNIWIFVCPLTLYTCGTAQTWEFLFLIGYACLTCHQWFITTPGHL